MRSITTADCGFNQATLAPSLPHQVPPEHVENTGTQRHHPLRTEQPDLDLLENTIRTKETLSGSHHLNHRNLLVRHKRSVSRD
jgi:hypothetical protein